jgi:D-alanine transaminase
VSIVYLNGRFEPLEEARISVMDRGFLFGDGVYEVIPAYGGRLFRLGPHLQRLQNSLDAIRLINPLATEQWREILETLLQRNAGAQPETEDQAVYLQVTRGVAMKRDHRFPEDSAPTVLAMTHPILSLDPDTRARGVRAITLPDSRWQHCHVKAITLLANVLLRQEAVDAEAVEAILVKDGLANEGAASNLFMVKQDVLITPPKSPRLLPGITRDLVLDLARENGIPCREDEISLDELRQAEEIWLTSSTREILPVTELDESSVGTGRPGPVWNRMTALYQAYKEAVRDGRAA